MFQNTQYTSDCVPCVQRGEPPLVDDPNKPLDEKEKKHFRKRSRTAILVCAAIIIIGTCFFREYKEILSFALGAFPVALSLAAAKFKSIWLNGQ